MNSSVLKIVLIALCLIAATGGDALAQARGSGPGPTPGGQGPGLGGPPPPPGTGSGGSPPAPGSGPGGGSLRSSTAGGPNGGAHSALGLGPVGRWWDNKSTVQTIGLSKDQTRKMDAIFNANKPAIVESYKAFLKQQSTLDALSKDPKVDKGRLFAAIDGVNQARSSLQKTTTQMLLQIRQQMDTEQLAKLDKLP